MFDLFHQINRQIRKFHNQLRVNPQSIIPYAEQRLGFFQQTLYFSKDLPNLAILTIQGVNAIKDLILYLQAVPSTSDLQPSLALQVAAYRHSQDLANNPHLNQHTGSDGTSAEDRVNCYGKWEGHLIEHVLFGFKDATQIIINLMADDGLGSRATRKNMMNKGLRQMGIGVCPHPLYGFVCVILYAKRIDDHQEVLAYDQVAQTLLSRELID